MKYIDIDLMDIESYDREDALVVFSEWFPKGDLIIRDLENVSSWNLPEKIRNLATNYRNELIKITEKLKGSMLIAPCFILLSIEQIFSSKFRLNMDS